MPKLSKKDTSLNERDSLADMRATERALLVAYAAAISEGGSRRLRTELVKRFGEAAEDLYTVSSDLYLSESSEHPPVGEEAIGRIVDEFKCRKKQIEKNLDKE